MAHFDHMRQQRCRYRSGRSYSLWLDGGGSGDRPPFLGISFYKCTECLRRLLIMRKKFVPEFDESRSHRGIHKCFDGLCMKLAANVCWRVGVPWGEKPEPAMEGKRWPSLLLNCRNFGARINGRRENRGRNLCTEISREASLVGRMESSRTLPRFRGGVSPPRHNHPLKPNEKALFAYGEGSF